MIFTIIALCTILSAINSARLSPRDVMDFATLQKPKSDSLINSFTFNYSLTLLRNNSTLVSNHTSAQPEKPSKWQVERHTRKQYEVINLLWRKTKIFLNVDYSTTPKHKQDNFTKKIFDLIQEGNQITFSSRSPISQTSTPSYIEFYYSDETDEQVEQRDCANTQCQSKNDQKLNKNEGARNSSFVIFHKKDPLLSKITTGKMYFSPFNIPRSFLEYTNKPIINEYKTIPVTITSEVSTNGGENIEKRNSNCKVRKANPLQNNSLYILQKNHTESTTLYDKIKFFELYDKHTPLPFSKKANMLEFQYNENDDKEIQINKNVHKILLEHVDQSAHEHKEPKLSKKHIEENYKNRSESCLNIIKGDTKLLHTQTINVTTEKHNITTPYVTNRSPLKLEYNEYNITSSFINKSVSWSEYPFAAVYVYEPSQVHCDAASISAHWLVASGSCLSRLNQVPMLGEGRSAFVAYCGESWWQPERVSYVKYSVVHPWFHPRDRTRRHLYNIGVIQVVTSMMSACSEWAPVSLMSHHFAATQGYSEALALGWGLDRYDTRLDLPKTRLMVYKGLVFSDSCPGNIEYRKIKRLDEGGGLNNIYCLSLPAYTGEEHDPVHGTLLLFGGKLTALYLQEERRPWGEQSAQYTGIWRLIPWVTDVAREPEEFELFTD